MKTFWSCLITLAMFSVGVAQTGTPPRALSPPVTGIEFTNLADGRYAVTIEGGRPTRLAPLFLLSFGDDGPIQPPPKEPDELETIVKEATANLPQEEKTKVAAEFIALAVLVKAAVIQPAEVPAKTMESVKNATGDSFGDWADFGGGVNDWLRTNKVDTAGEIVEAYQVIAKTLNGNSAINWNTIVPVILKILKGETIDWQTLIPVILEVLQNVLGR